MREYYEILGLKEGASKEQIKSAYRRLAMEFHPDKNKSPDAQKAFVLISIAYETLYNDNPVKKSTNSEYQKTVYDKWKNVNIPPKNPIDFNQWKKVKQEQARKHREKEREDAQSRFFAQKAMLRNSRYFYPIKLLYYTVMIVFYALPFSLFIFGIVYGVYDESWSMSVVYIVIMSFLSALLFIAIRYIHLELKRYFV